MEKKKRYWIIAISACLLIFMVKMCETEDFAIKNKGNQEQVEEVKQMQDESDSLLVELLNGIELREKNHINELDSLTRVISNKNLSSKDRKELERRIEETKKLLEEAKSERDTIVITADPIVRAEPLIVSSPIVKKDSVVYNIIKKDSIVYVDSIVYNVVEKDTIVPKIVYKIDTIHYDSDEIKKLKLKNN